MNAILFIQKVEDRKDKMVRESCARKSKIKDIPRLKGSLKANFLQKLVNESATVDKRSKADLLKEKKRETKKLKMMTIIIFAINSK